MIPMAVTGCTGTLQHATEVQDGFGVVRTWEDVCTVFATVYPSSSTQTMSEDGATVTAEVRIQFCLPSGLGVTVSPDDRVVVGDDTWRLTSVSDFQGSISARAVRIYE